MHGLLLELRSERGLSTTADQSSQAHLAPVPTAEQAAEVRACACARARVCACVLLTVCDCVRAGGHYNGRAPRSEGATAGASA